LDLRFIYYFQFYVQKKNSFAIPDDQIDPCQIVKCEMNKQDHSESFVIEVFIFLKVFVRFPLNF
jgi:hypothetical protein